MIELTAEVSKYGKARSDAIFTASLRPTSARVGGGPVKVVFIYESVIEFVKVWKECFGLVRIIIFISDMNMTCYIYIRIL